MRVTLSRREFLKLLGGGFIAATAARLPIGLHGDAPHWGSDWQVHFITCGGCPRGCSLRLERHPTRGWRVRANAHHPVLPCQGGLEYVLQNLAQTPLTMPFRRDTCRATQASALSWDEAVNILRDLLLSYHPQEIAFLVGAFPSDVCDLFTRLAAKLGSNPPTVWDAHALLSGVSTLQDAAHLTLGAPYVPYFDLSRADVLIAIGMRGDEPWLEAPLDEVLRHVNPTLRVIHLSPRRGDLPPSVEWLPLLPGSEPALLTALAALLANTCAGAFSPHALPTVPSSPAPWAEHLPRLMEILLQARAPLIVPGSLSLATAEGVQVARRALELNAQLNNAGRSGGMFLPHLLFPQQSAPRRAATLAELTRWITRLRAGRIKVLFIHGVDPLAHPLPGVDLLSALSEVEVVVSLSSRLNATSPYAHYLLPDRPALERWGYHQPYWGSDRPCLSALAPLGVSPASAYSTLRLFLEACKAGGVPEVEHWDEMDFIQEVVSARFAAWPEVASLAHWQEGFARGGWWTETPCLVPAVGVSASMPEHARFPEQAHAQPTEEFTLLPLWLPPLRNSGDIEAEAGWVELHPHAAHILGVRQGEMVELQSSQASGQARVRLNACLHPQVVALPVWGAGRALLEINVNHAGDFAWMTTRIRMRRLAT